MAELLLFLWLCNFIGNVMVTFPPYILYNRQKAYGEVVSKNQLLNVIPFSRWNQTNIQVDVVYKRIILEQIIFLTELNIHSYIVKITFMLVSVNSINNEQSLRGIDSVIVLLLYIE